jgi:hypothetical protein
VRRRVLDRELDHRGLLLHRFAEALEDELEGCAVNGHRARACEFRRINLTVDEGLDPKPLGINQLKDHIL